jgi:hypothetical protein
LGLGFRVLGLGFGITTAVTCGDGNGYVSGAITDVVDCIRVKGYGV